MNTLVITSKKILPTTDGGQVGTLGLIKYLHSVKHSITLVSFFEGTDYNNVEKNELQRYVDNIQTVKLVWKNTALNISIKYPNNIRKYTRKAMNRRLRQLKKVEHYDLVVIDHLQLFEYAKLFPESKIVLHTHNVESNIWKGYAKQCKGIEKIFVKRSARMLYAYECKAIGKADSVTACSDADLSIFKQMVPKCKAAVMKPYMLCDRVKTKEDIKKTEYQILYIGNYSWYPNQSAASFLMNELMPELRRRIAGVKLLLVGKNPTIEMKQQAEKEPDIIVTGEVESVDPFIKKSDVFVNAVTQGSGINIKMIEAMGKGIPIITTEFGARGLGVVHEKDVFIYKTRTECADYVQRMILNKAEAEKMADRARVRYDSFLTPSDKVLKIFSVNPKL